MSSQQEYDLKCAILDWACENLVGANISKRKEGKYWLYREVVDVDEVDAVKVDFKANSVLIWTK